MSEQSNKGAFSRREWLLVFAVVLMIEAWILNISYAFKDEQTVINYVSFAATIASLLLAVIAIIYGFYQSDGQKKSAAALDFQLDSMKSVQLSLNDASKNIGQQIQSITQATTHLERIGKSVDETQSQVGRLAGGMSELQATQEKLEAALSLYGQLNSKTEDISSPKESDSLSRKVLRQSAYEADLLAYWLWKYFNDDASAVQKSYLRHLSDHFAVPLGAKNILGNNASTWITVGYQLVSILISLGCLESKNNDNDGEVLYKLIPVGGFGEELNVFHSEIIGLDKVRDGVVQIESSFVKKLM